MNLLPIPELLEKKKNDSLVIFGSGYSINWIKEKEWQTIDSYYDTWGMGWYCKKRRPTTWYMVREQCTTPRRIEEGHDLNSFYEDMEWFTESTKVVKDMSYRLDNYQHIRHLDKLDGDGFVFKEIYGGCSVKNFRDDIFNEGIHHGKFSMYDALHFAVGMKYKKIVLCGVDLYDNRHFYLPRGKTTKLTEQEGNGPDSPHLTAHKAVKLFSDFIEHWKIPCFVHNSRSFLTAVMPIWDGI